MVVRESSENVTQVAESVSKKATLIAVAGFILTLLGFFAGSAAWREQMWWMLLVNFLFWTGMAQGAFVWSAILRTGQATWSAGVSRLGRSAGTFIIFSILIWVVLAFGSSHWLTWDQHPEAVALKYKWLSRPFYFTRLLIGLIIMAGSNFAYINAYKRCGDSVTDDNHHIINKLAIMVILVYVIVSSLLAFDMIMSLEPQWTSTLFGAYYFVGNLYCGMAALVILATYLSNPLGLRSYFVARHFSDMGNLMMGFGIIVIYLMFSHLLLIWYGNIPEEITFIASRLRDSSWKFIGVAVFAIGMVAPFLMLQSQVTKRTPNRLVGVAFLVLIGMWLERTLLVVPALSKHQIAGLTNPFAYAIPIMCAGVFVSLTVSSLRQNPNVSPLDVALVVE